MAQWQRGDQWLNRIICGDARDMAAVPDASVQLVVTSPPYNVAKDYSDHDDNLSLDQYVSLLNAVWRACYRVLAPGGRLCVNVANTDRKPYLSLVSLIDEQLRLSGQNWLHRGHIIWDKGACLSGNTKVYVRNRQTGVVACRRLSSLSDGGSWKELDVEGYSDSATPKSCWLPICGLWETDATQGLSLTFTEGCAVVATPDHRFVRTDGSLILAKDIRVGDRLRRISLTPDFDGSVPAAFANCDLAWALGLYLAEGSISCETENGVRTLRYHLHRNEHAWINRLRSIWEPFGGTISSIENGNRLIVSVTGYVVSAIVREFISGRTSHDKLPLNSVLGAPQKWRQAFLQGWLDGDGYFSEQAQRWEGNITGANQRLIPTLHALARSIGYRLQHGAGSATAEQDGKRHMVVRWKLYLRESPHHNAVAWDELQVKEITEDSARFFDLALADEPHLFVLADGLVSHNSAGVSTAWGSFGRASNPTLRDVHEYITVWSKDQLKLEGGGESGVTGNQFVAWTRSIWRPEELLPELQKKIAEKLADARKRDKDDAWIAESIARAVWSQAVAPGETIWEMTTESTVAHPAPFPVELPKRVIALYTQPGDVVLDPFMGSGSTAIAARLTGRHYVGYELSAEYCQLAEKRVREATDRNG
jgi:DNA modification methylase